MFVSFASMLMRFCSSAGRRCGATAGRPARPRRRGKQSGQHQARPGSPHQFIPFVRGSIAASMKKARRGRDINDCGRRGSCSRPGLADVLRCERQDVVREHHEVGEQAADARGPCGPPRTTSTRDSTCRPPRPAQPSDASSGMPRLATASAAPARDGLGDDLDRVERLQLLLVEAAGHVRNQVQPHARVIELPACVRGARPLGAQAALDGPDARGQVLGVISAISFMRPARAICAGVGYSAWIDRNAAVPGRVLPDCRLEPVEQQAMGLVADGWITGSKPRRSAAVTAAACPCRSRTGR